MAELEAEAEAKAQKRRRSLSSDSPDLSSISFQGVGYSALMMVFLENVYYIIIVAWTLFYILNTFYNITDSLPWSSCEQGRK